MTTPVEMEILASDIRRKGETLSDERFQKFSSNARLLIILWDNARWHIVMADGRVFAITKVTE